jgi:hypothetical protein
MPQSRTNDLNSLAMNRRPFFLLSTRDPLARVFERLTLAMFAKTSLDAKIAKNHVFIGIASV